MSLPKIMYTRCVCVCVCVGAFYVVKVYNQSLYALTNPIIWSAVTDFAKKGHWYNYRCKIICEHPKGLRPRRHFYKFTWKNSEFLQIKQIHITLAQLQNKYLIEEEIIANQSMGHMKHKTHSYASSCLFGLVLLWAKYRYARLSDGFLSFILFQ